MQILCTMQIERLNIIEIQLWNLEQIIILGCNPGQLIFKAFILRAASNTLPTAVNFKRWHMHSV